MSSTSANCAERSGAMVHEHLQNINLNEFPHETYFVRCRFFSCSLHINWPGSVLNARKKKWTVVKHQREKNGSIESENGLKATQWRDNIANGKFNKWKKKYFKYSAWWMEICGKMWKNVSKKYRNHFTKRHMFFHIWLLRCCYLWCSCLSSSSSFF